MAATITFFILVCILLCLCESSTGYGAQIQFTQKHSEIRPVTYYLSRNDDKEVLYKLICRGWQCPEFEVVNDETKFIQERKYSTFSSVETTLSECGNFSDILLKGYMALFRYRRGDNSEKHIMTMTVPVLTEVENDTSSNGCDTNYTIRFFLNQTDNLLGLPKPIENGVKLAVIPTLNVYVKTYGRYINDIQLLYQQMKEDLGRLDLCYEKEKYFVAMYDPPWKKYGRRNEIWIRAAHCSNSVNKINLN